MKEEGGTMLPEAVPLVAAGDGLLLAPRLVVVEKRMASVVDLVGTVVAAAEIVTPSVLHKSRWPKRRHFP